MAGGGVALIGTALVPLLSGLFVLNYGILKLKGNRIRHNPKKSVKYVKYAVCNRKTY